jgi:hypothetical protein
MSTKNLARTVIEGGRSHSYQAARQHSNSCERTWERVTSHKLLTATEFDDVVYRRRRKVWREFSDKLGPAERWLQSQAGRPWKKVRAELFARFDTRTTAGRHILFDHILPAVQQDGRIRGRFVFDVDAHGILRAKPRHRKLHYL